MGKSTISMAIFNCYVSSPEGIKSSSLDDSTVAVPTLINREPIPLQASMGLICQTKIGHNMWSMAISGTQIKLGVPTM